MKLKSLRIIALCLSIVMICMVFSACFSKCDSGTLTTGSSSETTANTDDDVSSEDTDSGSNSENNSDSDSDSNSGNADNNSATGNKNDLSSILSGTTDNSSSSAGNSSSGSSSGSAEEEEDTNIVSDYKGKERTVTVDLNKVVNTRFLGVGGNIVPYAYMPSHEAEGYNEAYYSFDMQRYNTMGLDMVRLWVQVDWFEKEKGVYKFDTPEMFSVCKVIEGLQKAGCNVQLTFSWKVGDVAIPWYSIPGLDDTDKYVSAPHDIEHFGTECAVLLKYLRHTKGYTNVKHITFGNEPNGAWDWETLGYQPAYYASVVESVDTALKKAGLRDEVSIWAAEASSGSFPTWLSYLGKEVGPLVDVWSIHQSAHTNDTLKEWIAQINGYAGYKPLFISEYQEGHFADYFEGGNAGHVIVGTQNGFAGFTDWDFQGVKHMSPTSGSAWEMEDTYTDGDKRVAFVFHNHFSTRVIPGSIGFHYYTLSMMTKWITADKNKVYKTETTLSNGDVRSTTIKNDDGSITVIVECDKSDLDREITVDFGTNVNKTFTRHVLVTEEYPENYEYDVGPIDVESKINPNGIIPLSDGTFKCGSSFTDKDIPNTYSIIVYTTMPTEPQIAFTAYDDTHDDSIGATVAAGGSAQIDAYILDGKASDEVMFKVEPTLDGKYYGTINNSTGLFTANTNAPAGEVISVRAELKSDPDNYKIFLIKIAE